MKKVLFALLILAAMVSIASAGIGINWKTQWGAYDQTASDLSSGSAGSIRENNSVIWQLIYSTIDLVANPAATAPLAVLANSAGNYLAAGEQLLAQRILGSGTGNATAADGTTWDGWLYNQGGDVAKIDGAFSSAGSFYQRVFQGTPAAGSWYYSSGLTTLNTAVDPLNPTTYQNSVLEFGSVGWTPESQFGIKPNIQFPVPEPATMSLLGLGALVMAIRRRRS
jgi:hypothetical protein